MNKSINGKKGNRTTIKKDEHFEPMFKTYPLADLKEENGELKTPDDNSQQMRKYCIENKK